MTRFLTESDMYKRHFCQKNAALYQCSDNLISNLVKSQRLVFCSINACSNTSHITKKTAGYDIELNRMVRGVFDPLYVVLQTGSYANLFIGLLPNFILTCSHKNGYLFKIAKIRRFIEFANFKLFFLQICQMFQLLRSFL